MRFWRTLLLALCAAVLGAAPANAQQQDNELKAIASTSIIADLVRNVGGGHVAITTLVGPDGDAHVYSPTPSDARKLASADIVFMNGLGLEGWMTRLVAASGSKAPVIPASAGVTPRKEDRSGRGAADPHAWQSVTNAKIYVTNIRDMLVATDPAGRIVYIANATLYLEKLDQLDAEIRAAIAPLPPERRKIVTMHDAFGYFGDAYGLTFLAPEGLATEAAPSAKDVARIVTLIKEQHVPAVFLENISDPRLIEEIARETHAKLGGTLYSDALSPPGGPAATYIEMMRHNLRAFTTALSVRP